MPGGKDVIWISNTSQTASILEPKFCHSDALWSVLFMDFYYLLGFVNHSFQSSPWYQQLITTCHQLLHIMYISKVPHRNTEQQKQFGLFSSARRKIKIKISTEIRS